MYALLLVIIYLAFISLGLPDSLLGAAWPVVHEQLGVPMSYAGIVSTIIACGTIVSSLLSDRLTRRFGAGPVTAVSVLMTAAALFGFSLSGQFWLLCLWAVPYGLGAGAVDAALNNYVALHYASRHMSWLHCFWGVGAAVSPYIMGWSLTSGRGWENGYSTVGVIQIVLTAILFLSLPMWKRRGTQQEGKTSDGKAMGVSQAIRIKGVAAVLITFFAYCAMETTTGLWASSYLVEYRGIDSETAARWASLFYIGITVGRFVSGFVADRLGDKWLLRIGGSVIICGVIMTALPLRMDTLLLCGLIVIGLGCAPIYPAIIHATPEHFGEENSQAIIGIQMASAYTGSTLMPPLFGLLADKVSIGLYPMYLLIFAVMMLAMYERLGKLLAKSAA